jgi:hypothetical protein
MQRARVLMVKTVNPSDNRTANQQDVLGGKLPAKAVFERVFQQKVTEVSWQVGEAVQIIMKALH